MKRLVFSLFLLALICNALGAVQPLVVDSYSATYGKSVYDITSPDGAFFPEGPAIILPEASSQSPSDFLLFGKQSGKTANGLVSYAHTFVTNLKDGHLYTMIFMEDMDSEDSGLLETSGPTIQHAGIYFNKTTAPEWRFVTQFEPFIHQTESCSNSTFIEMINYNFSSICDPDISATTLFKTAGIVSFGKSNFDSTWVVDESTIRDPLVLTTNAIDEKTTEFVFNTTAIDLTMVTDPNVCLLINMITKFDGRQSIFSFCIIIDKTTNTLSKTEVVPFAAPYIVAVDIPNNKIINTLNQTITINVSYHRLNTGPTISTDTAVAAVLKFNYDYPNPSVYRDNFFDDIEIAAGNITFDPTVTVYDAVSCRGAFDYLSSNYTYDSLNASLVFEKEFFVNMTTEIFNDYNINYFWCPGFIVLYATDQVVPFSYAAYEFELEFFISEPATCKVANTAGEAANVFLGNYTYATFSYVRVDLVENESACTSYGIDGYCETQLCHVNPFEYDPGFTCSDSPTCDLVNLNMTCRLPNINVTSLYCNDGALTVSSVFDCFNVGNGSCDGYDYTPCDTVAAINIVCNSYNLDTLTMNGIMFPDQEIPEEYYIDACYSGTCVSFTEHVSFLNTNVTIESPVKRSIVDFDALSKKYSRSSGELTRKRAPSVTPAVNPLFPYANTIHSEVCEGHLISYYSCEDIKFLLTVDPDELTTQVDSLYPDITGTPHRPLLLEFLTQYTHFNQTTTPTGNKTSYVSSTSALFVIYGFIAVLSGLFLVNNFNWLGSV